MAQVENISAMTAAATAADIPKVSNSGTDASGGTELGTSPAQERSSNSHPHDSEYDTASDLEGGEHDEYDDDEDEDDDDDDGESATDDEEDIEEAEDIQHQRALDAAGMEKSDEVQKKVDEDRSNPQYIPKRGTFYEHDDRTAEGVEGASHHSSDSGDLCEIVPGSGTNSQQSPTSIAQASKTMKKWQAASGVDRWSHDRFDASEQAPKSRAELVNAYGYDIRNEDAPPRARRRRRYGRGPSKYSRNWEDETAYLKASNTQRKTPRPADFPALNERTKSRKTQNNVREEKENRLERNRQGGTLVAECEKQPRSSRSGERGAAGGSDKQRKNVGNNKNKNFGRSQAVGRQAAMEFKNKQRSSQSQLPSSVGSRLEQHHSSVGNRLEQHHQTQLRTPNLQNNSQTSNEQLRQNTVKTQAQSRPSQSQPQSQGDMFNTNHDSQYTQLQHQQLTNQPPNPNSRPHTTKSTPSSNLSARLQQVQNRNDPSHVGSIQMHALANQNQLVGQQQAASLLLAQQQQQLSLSAAAAAVAAATVNHQDLGRPKRYSSIRRSQNDTQSLDQQQQQMQQLHIQQQPQAPQPLSLQDQQLLQANIMHLYHQENIQVQMQALQVSASQQPGKQKPPPTYAAVPPPTQQQQSQAQQYATGAPGATSAYYVSASDAYTNSAANAPASQATQFGSQQTNYLQGTPTAAAAAPMTYTSSTPPAQAVGAAGTVPTAGPLAYGGPNPVPTGPPTAPSSAPPAPGQPGYQNYANYQNYNTVGGTTYFVPPAQTPSRPVVLPQRRPTNAIPILPPSEKSKRSNQLDSASLSSKDDNMSKNIGLANVAPIGSAENIDHIIDNMFVQRPIYQPAPSQARKSSSPPTDGNVSGGDAISTLGSATTSQSEETSGEKPSNIESTIDNIKAATSVKEAI